MAGVEGITQEEGGANILPSGRSTLANKPTIISNIETDGGDIGLIRKDYTQDTWEATK